MNNKIAIYLRLSLADGDLKKGSKDESNSIENQRMLLHDYIGKQEDLFGEIVEYVDDGYTGTNFNRPAFQKMIVDLKTGQAKPLAAANSKNTDSWHNWSRDSHWFVFTSRRGDGLYTRLYLACIDDKGNVSKPFLLPQRNPKKYYDELLDSYNTPDFTSKPVELDARAAGNEIMSDKRIPTKVR